jgi:hypothetical protein
MSSGTGAEGASHDRPAGGGDPNEALPHDRAERLAANSPEHLSRGVPREEFLNAISGGATNHQLAERFGLTLRQANGLRIGLARRKALGSAAAVRVESGRGQPGGREGLAGQDVAPPDIIEAAVRFLRQTGDIVVRSGEKYVVNARQILTVTELMQRANRKRMERGRPAFGADALASQSPPS